MLEAGYIVFRLQPYYQNMLSVGHSVSVPARGDFLVNDKHTFEVEGKNKDGNRIRNIDNARLAVDNIEIGQGNRIPLWLFGYRY